VRSEDTDITVEPLCSEVTGNMST